MESLEFVGKTTHLQNNKRMFPISAVNFSPLQIIQM